jgi:hypothetical protein
MEITVPGIVLFLSLIAFGPPAMVGRFADESAGTTKSNKAARPLVVVAADEYRDALAPWLEHRSSLGFDVRLIDPRPVIESRGVNDAVMGLRDEIAGHFPDAADTSERAASPAGFVLLVGDAPGYGERLDSTRLIPAALQYLKSRPSQGRQFVTDNVYALPGSRGRPRLAVGRWPVRTAAEVSLQVQKSLEFERQRAAGLHRRDVTFIATTPNYDPLLDPVLEGLAMNIINGQIKPHWGLRAMYSSPASCYFPGPVETRQQVVRWLEDATLFTLFAGHGFDRGVDVVRCDGKQFPVLDLNVAAGLRGKRPGTVLWMSACSCGDYDLPPPHRGLAEELVMNPNGPTAVVAGTDETSAYVNLQLCLGLAQDVLENRPSTLGEAFVRFKRAAFKPAAPFLKSLLLSLEPTERPELLSDDHQFLYNLLGDPTLAINLPRKIRVTAEVTERSSDEPGRKNFAIAGSIENWGQGTAWVSFLIDRVQMKQAVQNPASFDREEDRHAAYFDRFLVANDKTAAQAQVQVVDGRFQLELSVPDELAGKVRWLQVYVESDANSLEGSQDGVGAKEVRLVDRPADRDRLVGSPD